MHLVLEGSKNVDNIPRHIVKKYLKADNKLGWEKTSRHIVVEPSAQTGDLLTVSHNIGDKVTRQNGKGNVSTAQSGYVF